MAKFYEIRKKDEYVVDFYSVEIEKYAEEENASTYDGVLTVFREIFKFIDFTTIIRR